MDYLTIGSYTIPYSWIAFFIAIIYLEVRNRKIETVTNKLFENAIWIYLFIWKLSYIPFQFTEVMVSPLSILYFDGGMKGHIIGTIIVIVYFLNNQSKLNTMELKQNWIRFVLAYQIVLLFGQMSYVGLTIAVIIFIMFERKTYTEFLIILTIFLIVFTGWLSSLFWITIFLIFYQIISSKQYKQLVVFALLPLIVITITNIQTTKATQVSGDITNIQLATTTGERYILSEQNSDITIVNFFATWCPPCNAEMPHLQSFSENLSDGIQLIGINLTARDNGEEALDSFLQKYEVTYPILLDEGDKYGKLFRVQSIPTTIILKNGVELKRIVGPVSEETLNKIVKNLN